MAVVRGLVRGLRLTFMFGWLTFDRATDDSNLFLFARPPPFFVSLGLHRTIRQDRFLYPPGSPSSGCWCG
jgi:hypothetical protein